MAESFSGRIHGDHDGVGLDVLEDVEQHARESEKRVGGAPVGGAQEPGSEERAEDEAESVDDDEALIGHGEIMTGNKPLLTSTVREEGSGVEWDDWKPGRMPWQQDPPRTFGRWREQKIICRYYYSVRSQEARSKETAIRPMFQ